MVESQEQPQALPFISFNQSEDSKFVASHKSLEFLINPKAVNIISQIQGPIGICSVAGMYRTGKSYLLNRMLLDRSNGFGVGPSINPCTKGLWIWSEPIKGTQPDGESISVVVIDTEGLGAFDETQNHDVRIFTLAILMSSFFIYNSMGSIDETSLNQLSLVVNLTKNIQLKEQKSGGEVDPEEYQKIFPSFMWVVRDFALQLTDENGLNISSREYLETALKEQKGLSDSVEQKNRIRRLLKTFFTERDCCTMVRPLSNESELQNLATKQFSELRTEFQEQVKVLRRKVLGKMKPKTLLGRQLTGSIIVNLAQQYVNSINNGAVPNIQSAWTYICQSECQKAMENSIKLFEEELSQVKLPCDDLKLQDSANLAKREAILKFKQQVFGSDVNTQKSILKEKLNKIINQVKEKNSQVTEFQMQEFLRQAYHPIEVSVLSGQFESIGQFFECIQEFAIYADSESPPGFSTAKSRVLKDFISSTITSAASHFCELLQNNHKTEELMKDQRIQMLESQLIQFKSELKQEIEETKQQLKQSECEKAEMRGSEIYLKESLQAIQKQKSEEEEKLKQELCFSQDSYKTQLAFKDHQLQLKQEQATEAQRQMIQAQSELNKQTALLEQKIEFLCQQAAERERKFNQVQEELQTYERQSSELIKQATQDLETELQEVRKNLDQSEDRVSEAQHLNSQNQERYENQLKDLQNVIDSLENQLNIQNKQIELLVAKLQGVGLDGAEKIEQLQSRLIAEQKLREDKEQEFKQKLNECSDQNHMKIKDLEKELAIAIQNFQFKQDDNLKLQSQLQERNHAHESLLKASQQNAIEHSLAKDQAFEKLACIELSVAESLKEQSRLFESQKMELVTKINNLQSSNSDLQAKSRIDSQEYLKQIKNLQDALLTSEQARLQLEGQIKQSDRNLSTTVEKTKEYYTQKIISLESEIETITQQQESTTQQIQETAERSLNNLKQLYEVERARQESRLVEEKESARRKLQQVIEEYETRIRDEQAQREEEFDILQTNMHENEQRYLQNIKQLENDNQLLQQKVQTIEERASEVEQRYERENRLSAKQLELTNERSNQERSEWQTRLSEAQRSVALKEQEIDLLKQRNDKFQQQLDRQQVVINEQHSKFSNESEKFTAKIEELKTKQQQISDESLRQKLDDVQAIALYKQKIEFQERKIDDQMKQNEESTQKYEQRLRQLKQESQQEITEVHRNLISQRDQLEQKFELKRKKYKEQQVVMHKRLMDMQKDKDLVDQQLANYQNVNQQLLIQSEQESNSLHEQISQLQDQLQAEREVLQSELDRVKQLLNDLEREHCDLQNTSERDKALLEGKCQFLEQQRDQAKADYIEASRKFEQTIEQIQKRGYIDKDRTESNQSAMLTQLEIKFKKQVQDQIEEKQRIIHEYEETISLSQKTQRDLKLELQLSERDRIALKRQLEKSQEEFQGREAEFRQLLQSSQIEKDSKSSSYVRTLESTRESQKQKIVEMETKIKEAETRRNLLIFELEKERAKWAIEKEQLNSRSSEYIDTIANLERQKESLLKDCEKLKTRKNQFVMKTSVAALKSPNRYPIQPSQITAANLEQQTKSIFVGGMSKALIQATKDTSDTSSQRSSDVQNSSTVQNLPTKSTENSLISRNTIGNTSLNKQGGAARVNVINFNMNRIKPLQLSSITNFATPIRQDQQSESVFEHQHFQ